MLHATLHPGYSPTLLFSPFVGAPFMAQGRALLRDFLALLHRPPHPTPEVSSTHLAQRKPSNCIPFKTAKELRTFCSSLHTLGLAIHLMGRGWSVPTKPVGCLLARKLRTWVKPQSRPFGWCQTGVVHTARQGRGERRLLARNGLLRFWRARHCGAC